MTRPSRGQVATAAVLALLVAFYAWTALTSADTRVGPERSDPNNLQASAFVHGQLHLLRKPPAALLALPDPYDPAQRDGTLESQVRDLTLYEGKLYTYWGPVPVLTTFVPFRALGVGDLPPALALLAFAIAALLAQAALLRFLVGRFAPATPRRAQLGALVIVGVGDVMPFMLRTPEVYEVAIGAGVCFVSAAVWLLATGALHGDGPRLGRLAGGSLCLGLAFGSRPTLGIAFVFALAALVALRRLPRPALLRAAAALLAPFVLCALGIAAYNFARFGSATEFGLRYTLTGFDIRGKLGHLDFLRPGAWYYLLEPLRPRAQFPFLWLGPPPYFPASVPADYEAPEKVAGLLWSVPVLLALACAPFALRRRGRALGVVLGLAALCGLAMLAFVAVYQPVATQRYEADGLVFLLPAAALAGLAWLWAPGVAWTRRRRLAAVAASLLGAWTVLVGVATSLIGYDDALRRHHPGTWAALEGLFAPVSQAMARAQGRPLVVAVGHDPVGPRPWSVASLDLDGTSFSMTYLGESVQIVAPHTGTATLTATLRPGSGGRRARRLAVRVRVGDGEVETVPVTGAAVRLVLRLRGGRNQIVLRPAYRGEIDARDVVEVAGLRLRQ
jgi:hypothetical protein